MYQEHAQALVPAPGDPRRLWPAAGRVSPGGPDQAVRQGPAPVEGRRRRRPPRPARWPRARRPQGRRPAVAPCRPRRHRPSTRRRAPRRADPARVPPAASPRSAPSCVRRARHRDPPACRRRRLPVDRGPGDRVAASERGRREPVPRPARAPTSRRRTRCGVCMSVRSVVSSATKRMVGHDAACAIGSACRSSSFGAVTLGRTHCGGMSRIAWPRSAGIRPGRGPGRSTPPCRSRRARGRRRGRSPSQRLIRRRSTPAPAPSRPTTPRTVVPRSVPENRDARVLLLFRTGSRHRKRRRRGGAGRSAKGAPDCAEPRGRGAAARRAGRAVDGGAAGAARPGPALRADRSPSGSDRARRLAAARAQPRHGAEKRESAPMPASASGIRPSRGSPPGERGFGVAPGEAEQFRADRNAAASGEVTESALEAIGPRPGSWRDPGRAGRSSAPPAGRAPGASPRAPARDRRERHADLPRRRRRHEARGGARRVRRGSGPAGGFLILLTPGPRRLARGRSPSGPADRHARPADAPYPSPRCPERVRLPERVPGLRVFPGLRRPRPRPERLRGRSRPHPVPPPAVVDREGHRSGAAA